MERHPVPLVIDQCRGLRGRTVRRRPARQHRWRPAVRPRSDGAADGAAGSIGWATVWPRVSARWVPQRDGGRLAITSGYGGCANRLPLDFLRVGDPAAPSGVVYRWDDRNNDRRFLPSELTPVADVGTCCPGGAASIVDPDLTRPTVWEFFVGVEHAMGPWRWRIVGLDRREHDPVALVNTGVALSESQRTFVLDPGIDISGSNGFTPLPVYGRTAAMFGRDRYELTNLAAADGGRYQGVEITVDGSLPAALVLPLRWIGSSRRRPGHEPRLSVRRERSGPAGRGLSQPECDHVRLRAAVLRSRLHQ